MKHVTISKTEAAAELQSSVRRASAIRAAWRAAEAAYYEAEAATKAAFRARVQWGNDLTPPGERPNWGLTGHPAYDAARAAEERAHERERQAENALVLAEAPDWRAWVMQFQLVREHVDELLNPLDVRTRKEKNDKAFDGSALAADIVTYALAAHAGLFAGEPYLAAQSHSEIPRLVSKLARKVTDIDLYQDHDVDAQLLRSNRDAFGDYGLYLVYRGAVRLAAKSDGAPPMHDLAAALERSDQLSNAASSLSDKEHAGAIEALDREASEIHEAFIAAPILTTDDAMAKLRWMKRAFTAGETGRETEVLAQIAAFLGGEPSLALDDPWHDEMEPQAAVEEPTPALIAAE